MAGEEAALPRQDRGHWCAARVHQVLDEVTAGGLPVLGLSGPDAADTVVELLRAASRLEGLALSVLAHADRNDVAAEVGATSTAAWLAHAARIPHPRARRLTGLAGRLQDPATSATAQALLAGEIDLAQAEVVVDAVRALPGRLVGAEDRLRAERHLLTEARDHDARRLQLLGRHLLAVIDPEAADVELGRRLEAEERQAAARTFLKLRDEGNGTCSGSFRIPQLQGAMLTTALHALASPSRPDPVPRTEQVPAAPGDAAEQEEPRVRSRLHPEILGEAFCEYVERFPVDQVPNAGGVSATVVVTVTLETLLRGLGTAALDLGGEISAGQARRLACQAGIIPAVMGGPSVPLDLGRRRRFFSPTQRVALGLRDPGCTAESCDRPAGWCHAHHEVPWSRGGRTDLADGRLLCPRHHRLVHHPRYRTTPAPDGRVRISRIRE